MANTLELAADVVAAHASSTTMTKDELIAEIAAVYQALEALEKGEAVAVEEQATKEVGPVVTKRKAFGKDKVYCMICGKGFTTLKRHLTTSHDMKAGEYRKQFGIPSSQPLAAKNYSESRKQMAIDRNLGEGLAKARAARTKAKTAKKK
jgi:predicted transcriptional regulator